MTELEKARRDNNEGQLYKVYMKGDFLKLRRMVENDQVPQTVMNCLGAIFGAPKAPVFWVQINYLDCYENWEVETALVELGIEGMQEEPRDLEVLFEQENLCLSCG